MIKAIQNIFVFSLSVLTSTAILAGESSSPSVLSSERDKIWKDFRRNVSAHMTAQEGTEKKSKLAEKIQKLDNHFVRTIHQLSDHELKALKEKIQREKETDKGPSREKAWRDLRRGYEELTIAKKEKRMAGTEEEKKAKKEEIKELKGKMFTLVGQAEKHEKQRYEALQNKMFEKAPLKESEVVEKMPVVEQKVENKRSFVKKTLSSLNPKNLISTLKNKTQSLRNMPSVKERINRASERVRTRTR